MKFILAVIERAFIVAFVKRNNERQINMARPRSENPKLSQNFRIPKDMHEKINAAAKEQGVPVTAILSLATEQWLALRSSAISLHPRRSDEV